jgi:hypothetical protein
MLRTDPFYTLLYSKMLLGDEYLQRDYEERGKRLLLTCCVCQAEGWDINERDYPEHRCNIRIPSCNDTDHSVCASCLDKLDGSCVYPYQLTRCKGSFFANKSGFDVECSNCEAKSKIKDPGKKWTCFSCKRHSCGSCDEEVCSCGSDCPKAYSRLFFQNGLPMRKHKVTRSMIDAKIERCCTLPWHHVECTSCNSQIYKTDACNDLHHCGKTSVCNWCGFSSFPWEEGILKEHWDTCNRWDVYLPWFQCKECVTEHQECRIESHQQSIMRLHNERYHAFINLIKEEFSWY